MHGAGAAQSGAAAEFRAGEFEMFADNPKKRRFGISLDARGFAIDRKGNRRHEYLPFVRCSCGYGLRIVCSALLENGAVFERPHVGRVAIIRRGILEALQA